MGQVGASKKQYACGAKFKHRNKYIEDLLQFIKYKTCIIQHVIMIPPYLQNSHVKKPLRQNLKGMPASIHN